jgi:ligand-binding sensor domain-containing protein
LLRLKPKSMFTSSHPSGRTSAFIRLAALAGAVVVLTHASGAAALDPSRSLAQYVHERYTEAQGFPMASVNALLPGRGGVLWIGTDEGLVRFDGARFVTYDRHSQPAMTSTIILSIAERADGSLWLGTEDGLLELAGDVVRAPVLLRPLPSKSVWALLQDGGTLWVGTNAGLVRLAGDRPDLVPHAADLPPIKVKALLRGRDGTIWVGHETGLARLDGGRLVRGPAELDGTRVTGLDDDRRGALWVTTLGSGVVRVHGARVEVFGPARGVPMDTRGVRGDERGDVWVGTEVGLVRLRGDHFESSSPADVDTRVWTLAGDAEGNLWVGTESSGLERYWDGDFIPFGAAEGLHGEFSLAVLQDRRDDVWVATYGGVSRLPGGRLTRPEVVVEGNHPLALHEDRKGDLWIGTDGKGLGRVRAGEVTWIATGAKPLSIDAIQDDADGSLWLGAYDGLYRLHDGALELVRDGLPEGVRVLSLGLDPGGSLWVGLETHGAYHRLDAHFEPVTGGPPRDRDVTDFHFDPDGTVWIGTLGAGLWRGRRDGWAGFGLAQGLAEDVVWRILDDSQGFLWLPSNRGVQRVARTELEAVASGQTDRVLPHTFGTADGMRTRECNGATSPAGWRGRDGRLWFVTAKGLAVVDPTRLVVRAPPSVMIDGVVVDGGRLPAPDRLILPAGTERLQVEFTAPTFIAPGALRFRYRLVGHDRSWLDAGATRQAHYTTLAPGVYHLQVQARAGNGPWSVAAVLPVVQRAFIYQTWWFLLALAVVSVGAAGGLIRYRIARAERRARELEQKVAEAVAEIKVLSGMLPICAWCKKVRDDEGQWHTIETYVTQRSDAEFTHGMCPECYTKHAR